MALPAQPVALPDQHARVANRAIANLWVGRQRLDDIPDAELDRLAEMGFDWVWFLSVWQTGPAAQTGFAQQPGWRKEFQETLPDLDDRDIAGSGFAIQSYIVHRDLGGDCRRWRVCDSGCKSAA